MRPLLLFFLLVLVASGAYAQNANERWSLQECVEYAFANSLNIKRSGLQVQNSEVLLFQSKASLLPTINGSASYSLNAGRSLDPTSYDYVDRQQRTSNISLNGNLLLFQGLQQQNTIRQARAGLESSQLSLEQSKNTVALNVALNYLQVLSTQELLEVARSVVEASQLQVNRTERLVDAGSQPQTELLNLKAQLAIDQASLVTAQNNLRIAKLNLMQSMNLPAQANFDVEQIEIDEPTVAVYEKSAAEVYAIAEKTFPSVQSADRLVISSEYAVAAARGELYPSLFLTGGLYSNYSNLGIRQIKLSEGGVPTTEPIGYVRGESFAPVFNEIVPGPQIRNEYYPYLDQMWDNLYRVVALQLNIPIFRGWQTRTRIRQSVIQRNTNELDAQNVRLQLRQDIEQAYNAMEAAAANYRAARDQVANLDLAYRATESRFNVGVANSVEFNLAKVNLDRARANLISAKYDYMFRVKILDFYQNKPLSF